MRYVSVKAAKKKKWWEEYKIVKDPKDFFGNKRKGEFIEIGHLQIPLELAKKYNSKKELLMDNLKQKG